MGDRCLERRPMFQPWQVMPATFSRATARASGNSNALRRGALPRRNRSRSTRSADRRTLRAGANSTCCASSLTDARTRRSPSGSSWCSKNIGMSSATTSRRRTATTCSGFGRRLDLHLGRFAAPQLPAPLSLGIDLRTEEKRDAAEPEPREQDHDGGERAPRLVVRAELAHVEREERRGREPDDDGDDGTEAQEAPGGMVDVRPKVEDPCEGDKKTADEQRPLRRPPDDLHRALGAD